MKELIDEKQNRTFNKNSLQYIYDQFVVVPIDKANGNVLFICKCLYIEMLIKVLGTDQDGLSNSSGTYNMCDINDQVVINEYSVFLKKYFKHKVTQDKKVLPSIH